MTAWTRHLPGALLAFSAPVAIAATVEHHAVRLDCDGGGFTHHESYRVALDTDADLETWSEWSTVLDDQIEILSCKVRVVDPGGKVVAEVPRRKHRRVESVGGGLYDSSWRLEVPFPPLQVGQRVEIDLETRHTPVWPGATIVLQEGDPQTRLEVDVSCPGGRLRWLVSPHDERFRVVQEGDRLRLEADEVPAWVELEASPDRSLSVPSLRLTWAADEGWPAVGAWYDRLRSTAPGPGAAVAGLAAGLCSEELGPRQRLEAVVAHVARTVRYEAVEIGPGGWMPSPPDEVLTRGWGDCKDQSLLLHSLLTACGVDSSLVLIRLGDGRGPDPSFPSPFWFNHCIVGVAASGLGDTDGAAVEGLVLVDPTNPEGDATWLDSSCRDRPALVVSGVSSRLIRVPPRGDVELTELEVTGALDGAGRFTGVAELRLDGSMAADWSRYLRTQPSERTEEVVSARLARLMPGVRVSSPEHHDISQERPAVRLKAAVALESVAAGPLGQQRVLLPGLDGTPDPRILESRSIPVVVSPGRFVTRWTVTLPAGWCPPEERADQVSTAVGRASLEVRRSEDGQLLLERQLELDTAQVDPEELEELRKLAVFESRAARRSIRLRCEGE